jgi:hypothetical protein
VDLWTCFDGLVDTCGVYKLVDAIYICYVLLHDIYIGCRQRALCRAFLVSTLSNSGKNFPSSGVPSIAEHSCTGRSAKNFILKK